MKVGLTDSKLTDKALASTVTTNAADPVTATTSTPSTSSSTALITKMGSSPIFASTSSTWGSVKIPRKCSQLTLA